MRDSIQSDHQDFVRMEDKIDHPKQIQIKTTQPLSKMKNSNTKKEFSNPLQNVDKKVEHKHETTPIYLIIGFDLGTSTSKVVVQAPDLTKKPTWVVDFKSLGYENQSYLLPTMIYNNSKDHMISLQDNNSEPYRHIKTGLLNSEVYTGEIDERFGSMLIRESLAAAYMGFALRYVKGYILELKHDLLSRHQIIWNLNLGITSPTLDNFEEKDRFLKVAAVGWKLSLNCDQSLNIDQVKKEIKEYENDADKYKSSLGCSFYLIPEIIAGSYGYALSRKRRNGLHIIVDIGASTVDVCGFKLSKDKGLNNNALYATTVQPLGTFLFHKKLKNQNYLQPINDEEIDLDDEEVKKNSDKFKTIIRAIIHIIYRKIEPDAPEFMKDNKLPFIVIGGGSNSDIYWNWINCIQSWILFDHIKNRGLDCIDVPLPANITNDIDNDQAKYLTVAWGLSHRDLDIGRFIPTSKIPKTPEPQIWDGLDNLYVSKEMV